MQESFIYSFIKKQQKNLGCLRAKLLIFRLNKFGFSAFLIKWATIFRIETGIRRFYCFSMSKS